MGVPSVQAGLVGAQGIVLSVGVGEVGQRTDDVVVAYDVVHGVAVLQAVVLVDPVGVLQHHGLQPNVVGVGNAQLHACRGNRDAEETLTKHTPEELIWLTSEFLVSCTV